MDAFDKVRSMLEEANAAFRAAKDHGDDSAAAEIETSVIDPLKSQLAGLALSALETHAARINAFAAKLEQALLTLQRRVDRLFVDRLIEKANELGLTTTPMATGGTPPIAPAPAMTAPAVPAVAGETPGVAVAPAAEAPVRTIVITDVDLDALQRTAQSEVGHFGKYGPAQLGGGLAAVIDTILNRTAHPRWPDTIQAVVDQPLQFSAINETGSWVGLPIARPNIAQIVEAHVAGRAAGKASEIEGATHFLNPHLASGSAMANWGRHVADNAVAVFGSEADKDVHYHGFAPGTALPPPYAVQRNGVASIFGATGRSVGGPPSNREFRNDLLRVCREELARFDGGAAKETDDPQFLRVGDYWQAIGSPNNGRTLVNGERPAWSAAFISFVMRAAGAGDRFKYSAAHCHYFQDFVSLARPGLFQAVPANDAILGVGDIVHHGRGDAKRLEFAAARAAYANDTFYPSHSAIVVAVDREKETITTIGGNESDSVREATFDLDETGRLKPYRSGSSTFPWIGVLQLA